MSPFLRFFKPLSGLFFWAAQFAVIYAATALACARGGDLSASLVPPLIATATLAALLATGAVFLHAWRLQASAPADTFLNALTLWANGLTLVAIAWNAVPALILPVCG